MTVRVGRDLDYDDACSRYGLEGQLELWQVLGDGLAHRPGWHFDLVNDDEPMWSFGAFGMSLLCVFVNQRGGYECFDYYGDDSSVVWSVSIVLEWVYSREEAARARGVAPYELFRDQDWKLLAAHTMDLDVTWSDGIFVAAVRDLPSDAALQPTLAAAISAAAEMVAHHVGAPRE